MYRWGVSFPFILTKTSLKWLFASIRGILTWEKRDPTQAFFSGNSTHERPLPTFSILEERFFRTNLIETLHLVTDSWILRISKSLFLVTLGYISYKNHFRTAMLKLLPHWRAMLEQVKFADFLHIISKSLLCVSYQSKLSRAKVTNYFKSDENFVRQSFAH